MTQFIICLQYLKFNRKQQQIQQANQIPRGFIQLLYSCSQVCVCVCECVCVCVCVQKGSVGWDRLNFYINRAVYILRTSSRKSFILSRISLYKKTLICGYEKYIR